MQVVRGRDERSWHALCPLSLCVCDIDSLLPFSRCCPSPFLLSPFAPQVKHETRGTTVQYTFSLWDSHAHSPHLHTLFIGQKLQITQKRVVFYLLVCSFRASLSGRNGK